MNIYHFMSDQTWYDDENEHFVIAPDEDKARELLGNYLIVNRDPVVPAHWHKDVDDRNIARFKRCDLFGHALEDAEAGVLYSVFTPG